jgi:mono/diheme cytochrome c family protein
LAGVFRTNQGAHINQGAHLSTLLGSIILFAASSGLMAEEVETGDPQAGFTCAKEVCANCHAISSYRSPVPKATAFDQIANVMSADAILMWMRTTHPMMPNITLEQEDLIDVIAYILSLKAKSRSGNQ